MAETTLQMVGKKEKQFTDLWARMDSDAKLAYGDEYALKGTDGKAIPGVVSVTMNDAAIYLNTVVSLLIAAVWQTAVEGAIPPKQQILIERFAEDCLGEANERLMKMPEFGGGAFPFFCNHICLRGRIGARWLFEEDERLPSLLPIDMRYCSYSIGPRGFVWVAPRFNRSKEDIKEDYGKDISTDEAEVVDYWDAEKNEIWIAKELVDTRPNPLGYPPFVAQVAPAGFMLLDKGYMVHEGESIFFLNRDLYSELNRIVSIDQTLAMKAIMPPYQKPTDQIGGDLPPYPDGIGKVVEVLKGEEYQLIQKPDINMASRLAHSNIGGAIGRGGVSNIDLGTLQQPSSALYVTTVMEIRNKLLSPRLVALGSFYQQLIRMAIDQYVKLDIGGSIGHQGKRRVYSASQLGNPGDYAITYKLMSKSKTQEVANLTIAVAARGTLPRDAIIRDILLADDPEGMIAKLEDEEAETLAPVIKYFRRALAAIDVADMLQGSDAEAKRMESRMLTEAGLSLLRQRSQQAVTPPIEQKVDTSILPPLMSAGNAGGRKALGEEVAVENGRE